jgi:serine/threonine protein kinase
LAFKLSWIVPLLICSTLLAFSAPAQVVQTHPLGVSSMILTQTSTSISEGFEPTGRETFVEISTASFRGWTYTAYTAGGYTYSGDTVPPVEFPVPVTITMPAGEVLATRTIEVQQFITTMTTVYTAQTWQGIALEGIVGPLPFYSRSFLLVLGAIAAALVVLEIRPPGPVVVTLWKHFIARRKKRFKEPIYPMSSESSRPANSGPIPKMSEVAADSLRLGFEVIPDTSPNDKMRVLESIQGGMGRIIVVANASGDRFAVKTFKYPEDMDDYKKTEKRFYREAALWVGLGKHPNIVRALSFGKMSDDPYLLLEFIDGVNLRRLIADRQLDLRRSLQVARDVCSGLMYAHTQGVVHGDIKPENILIDRSGRAKVTDFGLSRVPGEIGTLSVEILGTLAYMPPEQLFSESEIDERSDIYSFGIVLYEMLTYKNPFRSRTVKEVLSAHQLGEIPVPSSVQKGIPREIDRLVLRSVKRNPSERFRYFGELIAILEKYGD